jgi:hypothetical protein
LVPSDFVGLWIKQMAAILVLVERVFVIARRRRSFATPTPER